MRRYLMTGIAAAAIAATVGAVVPAPPNRAPAPVVSVKDTTGTIQCPADSPIFVVYQSTRGGDLWNFGICYPVASECAATIQAGQPLPATCKRHANDEG